MLGCKKPYYKSQMKYSLETMDLLLNPVLDEFWAKRNQSVGYSADMCLLYHQLRHQLVLSWTKLPQISIAINKCL